MQSYDFFIGFELTRHCNLRCAHCMRDDLDLTANLPIEFIQSILEQATAYNKPHIAMTGGEVTLHPQFGEIIDLLVEMGYGFHFVTNGTTFPKVMQRIGPYAGGGYWKGVSISLDGATEETHDAVRGAGVFKKALNAIALCRAKGVPVTIQMVVNRLNRHEMRQMAELCTRMRVNQLFIAHMQPTPHGLRDDIVLPPEDWLKVDEEVLQLGQTFRLPIYQSAGHYDMIPLSHCKFLRNGALNIDYVGRLTVCCQLSNTGGMGDEARDVVADLNKVTLAEGHARLLDVYNDVHKARLHKMHAGGLQGMDNYHCWFCMKHFKKLNYMKNFPNHPWVKGDSEVNREVADHVKRMRAYQ